MSRLIGNCTQLALLMVLVVSASALAQGHGPSGQTVTLETLRHDFDQRVQPFLEEYCHSCHDEDTQEAKLDLSVFRQLADIRQAHQVWATILERVESGEMPPEDGDQPDENARHALVEWIRELRHFEAERNAGDPGPVLARRLSNAEYDYAIRDLTGVDLNPTATFPVDPANEAGFDNSGESLSMSPALMSKYLSAARSVVDHLVFTPRGLTFAPHSVVTDTDRDKYCVKRIVEFYRRQPTDYADYFFAAWWYLHQGDQDTEVTLEDVAAQRGVSAKYLAVVWDALSGVEEVGPLHELQTRWNALPAKPHSADSAQLGAVRAECERLRDWLVETRYRFQPEFDNLRVRGVHKGTQPFVLWKNDQYAAYRRAPGTDELKAYVDKQESADRSRLVASCERFCSLFPDAFVVSERGRGYLDEPRVKEEAGRLLSAGFHSMMGYYRDDRPLYELILEPQEQQELDALWEELDFFTAAPLRQYQGFLWFDRTDSSFMRDSEFDFARPENSESLRSDMIDRLSEVYLAKAIRNGGEEVPLRAIRDYFQNINRQIRWVEDSRVAAEPHQLNAVVEFASRAYRRPLTAEEDSELRRFYQQLCDADELSHEQAIQDTLVSVLMSPNFLYRVDLLSDSTEPRALDEWELASRLSFFLWASLPDERLLAEARRGQLRERDVLLAQTRRMLLDRRVRGLATEFGGNWLDFRRFEEHNSVDRDRFPSFTDELRASMFEEPIRFFLDVIQNDRSTLDFLFADRTFVNAALAKHYGIDFESADDQWREVSPAAAHGRGGLLPMSVFLTKNAPGFRTSPVKRGYWVVRTLLGERIPPPPPDVPELPSDESLLGELTLSEALARHRDHESCAGCHNKIDPMGLVFEGFGPIGERRDVDLGGRPVETTALFPDGTERKGVDSLRRYLREKRIDDFAENLHRKLLSYALGRTLILSDEILLRELAVDAAAHEYRFVPLVEAIVTSPQFLNKRGRRDRNSIAPGDFDAK